MYAWRARIGLIKPTHRGKSFHFWYDHAPAGVEIVPTFVGFRRSDRQTFEKGFERIEEIADDLKAVGCQLISLSGTPPVLLKGLDFEREWRDRLSQKIGLPVISQMEPHALALVALGVKRVALATYYGDELNNAIKRYFARFDDLSKTEQINGHLLLGRFAENLCNQRAEFSSGRIVAHLDS